MPIEFEILKGVKLVVARAHGRLTAEDMMSYQRTVWSDPNIIGFDGLVDVTGVESFAHEPNSGKARILADLSAKMDFVNQSRKFASWPPMMSHLAWGKPISPSVKAILRAGKK